MTREEAITQLELLLEYCESMMTSEDPVWRRDCEALQKDKEFLFDALSEAVSGWGDISKGEKTLADSILVGLKGEK